MKRFLLAAAVSVLGLAACEKPIEAPSVAGECYLMAAQKDGSVKFNRIAEGIKDLEHCAVEIEIVRRRFQSLGSTQKEWIGAYSGSFVFVEPEGVLTSTKLDGIRYPALVRYNDSFVMPGAIVERAPAEPPAKK
jgi:hypothetical protein